MSAVNDAQTVAVVGAPSTNSEITLDLLGAAIHEPLVGAMLFTTQQVGDHTELALGTVTEVTTLNQWHNNPLLKGVIKERGSIAGMSGDKGDVRDASVRLQACYKCESMTGDPSTLVNTSWSQAGPSFRMSPSTGTKVRRVTNEVLDELVAGEDDLHFLGVLHNTNVRAPMSVRDFSGSRGAWHGAIFGQSGSGKALALDTPIPTPRGWTAMGDLVAGDTVFDENGQPCRVEFAHEIRHGRDCYEVVFSDGSVITADAEHNWWVEDAAYRRAQSHARTVPPAREALLDDDTLGRLRAEALAASPDAVITRREIGALAGLAKDHSAIVRATNQVGAVGSVRREGVYQYAPATHARTRDLPTWNAHALLGALADYCDATNGQRLNQDTAQKARAHCSTLASDARITFPQVAAIVGVSARNGSLRNVIAGLGVERTISPVTIDVALTGKAVTRNAPNALGYPKAAVLAALAEWASQPVRDQRSKANTGRVLTTAQMLDTVTTAGGQARYAVPVAGPLDTVLADLSVGPYTLGAWLGDGTTAGAAITTVDDEVLMKIEAEGYVVHRGPGITHGLGLPAPARPVVECGTCGTSVDDPRAGQRYCSTACRRAEPSVTRGCTGCGDDLPLGSRAWMHEECREASTLRGLLRGLGVLGAKHIPSHYLRSNEAQRRALLAGLLDSDGTVAPRGTVHFDNTNEPLARGVYELVASLGYRPTWHTGRATLDGRDCGPTHRVAFTTADQVFGLERKRAAHKERTARHNPAKTSHRYITEIRPVASVPVRCITVDSPNSLYLAGQSMIPTHNTAMAAYVLGSQLRHRDHGMIIIDPQGQWSGEKDLPFSLQAWAAELGREVVVRRISEDLRLAKDAPLFGELISKTKFLRELMKMSEETREILTDEMVKALRLIQGWNEMASATLMESLLEALSEPMVLRRIYADFSRQQRLQQAISEVLGRAPDVDPAGDPINPGDYPLPTSEQVEMRRKDLLAQFGPLHNLFSETNPGGGRRHSLWGTIKSVFDRPDSTPAPLVILDMSTAGGVSWLDDLLADEDSRAAMDALRILDQDTIKAAILRQTCATLKNASEDAFRSGTNLNTMVVFDEAWRYAPPPGSVTEQEIKDLSTDLAGYARDTRKFGIGWFYITQSPRSLNNEIWDQLSVRIVGYGLSGGELSKVGETLDDPDHLKLYRSFAPPDSTRPRVYPFMVSGPVSPLSFTKAPLFIAAYTDFDEFRVDNAAWIAEKRYEQGLPIIQGTPATPVGRPAARATIVPRRSQGSAADRDRVRQHASSGGVDPRATVGLSGDAGFSGGLSSIDDDEKPPF